MSSKGDPPQAVVSSSLETGDAARSSGLESTEEDEAISTVNETRLKWKIDLFIMPIMCSISFLGQVVSFLSNEISMCMNRLTCV